MLLMAGLLAVTGCADRATAPPSAVPTSMATTEPAPSAASPTPTTAPRPTQASSIQSLNGPLRSTRMIVTGDSLWAGHPASQTVTRLDLPSGHPSWQTQVDCEPATLALAESGLYAACFDSGELLVLDAEIGTILARTRVGYGPFGVIVLGGNVYVTLAYEDSLLVLDEATLAEVKRVATNRQPRGLALQGDRLYVGHLLDASVQVFNVNTLEPLGDIRIGHQAAFAETLTIRPETTRAYVPHQRQNITNMARLFDSTVFPVVSALDLEQLRPIRSEVLALDTVDTPVSMPIASVLSLDGRRLYVANAASDDISVIDPEQGTGLGHIIVGQQPREVALSPDGKLLYVLNLISDDITVVDTDELMVQKTILLAEDPRPAIIQQGERFFSTSRPDGVSRDNWIACASCHFDAGFDSRTWLGTFGGARNTPVLRGIGGTEPLHWSADRANVQAFEETFASLMAGTGLTEVELDALAAYLDSLEPLDSPYRRDDGSLSVAATHGSELFKSSGCALCHSLPQFTDLQLHDVGTGEPFQDHPSIDGKVAETMGTAFDTPSLRELWHTEPYLHDGRALTLRDVLLEFNPAGLHGKTTGLSQTDLEALEAFLLSLPLTPEEVSDLFPN